MPMPPAMKTYVPRGVVWEEEVPLRLLDVDLGADGELGE